MACVLLAPQIEEAAVTQRQVFFAVDAEPRGGAINPFGRALEFRIIADGRLVDDTMSLTVFPLGTPLLIAKGRDETEGEEDGLERAAIRNFRFGFDAMFMAIFAGTVVRQTLVGERPTAAVVANAQNLSVGAHLAIGCVIEDVAFEAAWRLQAESGGSEPLLENCQVSDSEFDLGLDSHR